MFLEQLQFSVELLPTHIIAHILTSRSCWFQIHSKYKRVFESERCRQWSELEEFVPEFVVPPFFAKYFARTHQVDTCDVRGSILQGLKILRMWENSYQYTNMYKYLVFFHSWCPPRLLHKERKFIDAWKNAKKLNQNCKFLLKNYFPIQ